MFTLLYEIYYKLCILSSNIKIAGTDADVYVTVFGDQGDTGQKFLDNKLENNFERGKEDIFHLKEATDILLVLYIIIKQKLNE